MTPQEFITKIKWKEPKLIYTKEGTALQHTAVPGQDFWSMWRIDKEIFKAVGILPKKANGQWLLIKQEEFKQEEAKLDKNFKGEGLRDYQIPHAQILIADLIDNNAALDASDTGTGKTYTALAIAKYLNLYPMIVTNKTIVPGWKRAAKKFGIRLFVTNYEKFKSDKTEYAVKHVDIIKQKNKKTGEIKEKEVISYEWNLPDNCILIFDEVHRCKNPNTQNSAMLEAAVSANCKVLPLSATIADNPLQMYAIGKVLKLFSGMQEFMSWCFKRGVRRGYFGGYEFKNSKKLPNNVKDSLKKIHADIFPHKGHRMSIRELGDKFPANQIIAETYDMETSEKIQQAYEIMQEEIAELKRAKKKDKGSVLTAQLRARQEIELLKVPAFAELAEDHIEEGMSVAVFFNFNQSVEALCKLMKTECIITGKISATQKEKNRVAFQKGKERLIICNSRAGGVGIDLHDEYGNYPRVSLISPSYSAQDLKQDFGRIHRDGALSPALQKIVFCANTIEEEVADKVEKKLKNIELINDGDLEEL